MGEKTCVWHLSTIMFIMEGTTELVSLSLQLRIPTLRDQWRNVIRLYNKSYSHAWEPPFSLAPLSLLWARLSRACCHLPEVSKDPSVVAPFPIEQHLERSYSYLDVVGRTVLVLQKKIVVPEHNQPFQRTGKSSSTGRQMEQVSDLAVVEEINSRQLIDDEGMPVYQRPFMKGKLCPIHSGLAGLFEP